jgi:hypothetical protein
VWGGGVNAAWSPLTRPIVLNRPVNRIHDAAKRSAAPARCRCAPSLVHQLWHSMHAARLEQRRCACTRCVLESSSGPMQLLSKLLRHGATSLPTAIARGATSPAGPWTQRGSVRWSSMGCTLHKGAFTGPAALYLTPTLALAPRRRCSRGPRSIGPSRRVQQLS